MLKNIETGIINYVPSYYIQTKFTKLLQSTRKKCLDKPISQKSLRVTKPLREQFQICITWSVCKFSIKSYKMLRGFWDQFAQNSLQLKTNVPKLGLDKTLENVKF